MSVWNYIVLGASMLLLLWLIRKEWARENGVRRLLRVAAVVLAVGALACMELPVTYNRHSRDNGREGILLTEGYDKDSVRAFRRAHPGAEVWDWSDGSDGTGTDRVGSVGDEMGTSMTGSSKLHVFGYGLTKEQWAGFHPSLLAFHPSPERSGVTDVNWDRKLAPGERLRVRGNFLYEEGDVGIEMGKPGWKGGKPGMQGEKRVKLVLTGLGMALDSVEIGARKKAAPAGTGGKNEDGMSYAKDFELSTIPAQAGRSVYHLAAVAGADTIEQEELPVEVVPGKTMKILLLASSPDFENTFLMNWLSRNGHAVARRTVISRGKYDKAFVNMPEGPLSGLSPSLLGSFDLVIADASALAAAGGGELSALRREVGEKGLGLIIKIDSAAKGEVGIGGAGTVETGIVKDSSQRLYIKEKPGLQALLRDSLSRITVGVSLYGAGKIVFTTLNTTYSQVLSGGAAGYAAYWSEILGKAAREGPQGEEWRIEPSLPGVGEPVRVRLQTAQRGLPQAYIGREEGGPQETGMKIREGALPGGGRSVYLAQEMQLPFYWQGTYWPEEAGWQFARSWESESFAGSPQGEPFWWYVWPEDGWRNLHRRERRQATLNFINGIADAGAGTEERDRSQSGMERVPIPKGWFYVVFLLCVLFLWVERKIEWMNGRIVR